MKKNKSLQVVLVMLPMLLLSLWSFGQSIKVHGTVNDASRNSLPGVSVVVKGTTNGTI